MEEAIEDNTKFSHNARSNNRYGWLQNAVFDFRLGLALVLSAVVFQG